MDTKKFVPQQTMEAREPVAISPELSRHQLELAIQKYEGLIDQYERVLTSMQMTMAIAPDDYVTDEQRASVIWHQEQIQHFQDELYGLYIRAGYHRCENCGDWISNGWHSDSQHDICPDCEMELGD